MLRQGINRHFVSDIGRLLRILDRDVRSTDSPDALTKEQERAKYEDIVFQQRDVVNVQRRRTKRWKDEREERKNPGG